jgi:hypothetical protein
VHGKILEHGGRGLLLMTTVLVDPAPEQGDVRHLIYRGDLVLFTNVTAVAELVDFARDQLTEIFAPFDPEEAHLHFSPEEAANILAKWKPAFMRLERTKQLLKAIVEEVGFPLNETHVDLLKARTAFPVGHLSTGIAFAFPWHRDTWYAAPAQQINWWLPIFEVFNTNAMKFDLARFAAPVSNSSTTFDYYTINRDRLKTATQTKVETQSRPAAIDHDPDDFTVVLPRPGSVLLFSGNHLHATIPNESGRSRYSIDFRTVDRRDVIQGVGAQVVDADCTGTSLRDFVNAVTGDPFDEELVRKLHGDPPVDAFLVFPSELSTPR